MTAILRSNYNSGHNFTLDKTFSKIDLSACNKKKVTFMHIFYFLCELHTILQYIICTIKEAFYNIFCTFCPSQLLGHFLHIISSAMYYLDMYQVYKMPWNSLPYIMLDIDICLPTYFFSFCSMYHNAQGQKNTCVTTQIDRYVLV